MYGLDLKVDKSEYDTELIGSVLKNTGVLTNVCRTFH